MKTAVVLHVKPTTVVQWQAKISAILFSLSLTRISIYFVLLSLFFPEIFMNIQKFQPNRI